MVHCVSVQVRGFVLFLRRCYLYVCVPSWIGSQCVGLHDDRAVLSLSVGDFSASLSSSDVRAAYI